MSDESQCKIAYFPLLIVKGSPEWLVHVKTPTIMNMWDELNLPRKVLTKGAGTDTDFDKTAFKHWVLYLPISCWKSFYLWEETWFLSKTCTWH